jgi:hypothetical protein
VAKAQRIRELYKAGKSIREIAEIVGCLPEYVRVVARQRTSASGNPIQEAANRNWRAKHPEYDRARFRRWYWERGGRERQAARRVEARAS